MILGCELVLGIFVVGFGVALVQQFSKAKPQSTIEVFAQLVLVLTIGGLLALMIAIARDPMLTFAPKLIAAPEVVFTS